jgi:hypothetical protein
MVVVQRNEVSRTRILSLIAIVLAASVMATAIWRYSVSSDAMRVVLILLAAASVIAVVLAFMQIFAHPKRSQVILFQRDGEFAIATNAIHEGFKLRFLRDILGENVFSFSDEDRARWKPLEADGFYATLYVRDVRKVIMLRLCTMIFDDVFVADRNNRWEHHDSSCTAEPSFSRREMPPLKTWKAGT